MKIPEFLGRSYKEVEKEYKELKVQYCEGCGALCTQKIELMNTLYDTDTGKEIKTYRISTRCPKPWYLKIFGNPHTGDTVSTM